MKKTTHFVLTKVPIVGQVYKAYSDPLLCSPMLEDKPNGGKSTFELVMEYSREHPDVQITRQLLNEIIRSEATALKNGSVPVDDDVQEQETDTAQEEQMKTMPDNQNGPTTDNDALQQDVCDEHPLPSAQDAETSEQKTHATANSRKKIFRNSDSLQQVANIINESEAAISDKARTIQDSPIKEVLQGVARGVGNAAGGIAGAAGAAAGGAIGFLGLYALGTTGLSAAGITSGLATAGALVGGGMVAGVGVLAAPAVALGVGGYAVASNIKGKRLEEEKRRLYKEALAKHQAIIDALQRENQENKGRIEYLTNLNVLLERAISDLAKDLGE